MVGQSRAEWLDGILLAARSRGSSPVPSGASPGLLLSGSFTLRVLVLPSEKWEHSSILKGWSWGPGSSVSKLKATGKCHFTEVVVGRTALLT